MFGSVLSAGSVGFFDGVIACGESCGVCDQELCHACRVSRPLLLVSLAWIELSKK